MTASADFPPILSPSAERRRHAPRRGLRREEAARYIGVSASKFDQMVKDGRMPGPKRVDGMCIWDCYRLDDAFDALPDTEVRNPWDAA